MITAGSYRVRQRFMLSTRLDDDLEAGSALDGYQLTESGLAMLERVAEAFSSSSQRAFTWTGTYGSGKSSLALFMCALLSPSAPVRKRARAVSRAAEAAARFKVGVRGWAVARLVAGPGDLETQVRASLRDAACERHDWSAAKELIKGPIGEVVSRIAKRSSGTSGGGLLIVIDELGRALEGGDQGRVNLHFVQDLAEAANRSAAPALLVGVLHQAFMEYAGYLTRAAQDEWSKVQGRFVDIPMAIAQAEVLDLVGDAIIGPGAGQPAAAMADAVAGATAPAGSSDVLRERLERCWPLHPVTALLLAPLSRRRFGQNERSVFSFLCSGEPEGFARFVSEGAPRAYGPERLWDYLEVNLESAILASPDGHRWAEAADAVERARRRGGPVHVEMTKIVGLVDLFGRQTALKASLDLLAAASSAPREEVEDALKDLRSWSVLVHRGHLGSWGVFAGSDLDVEQLIDRMRSNVDTSEALRAVLGDFDMPVIAKRHYVETGTLRWFTHRFVTSADLRRAVAEPQPGDGTFLLSFPGDADAEEEAPELCRTLSAQTATTIVGWAPKGAGGRDAAVELAACAKIRVEVAAFRGDSVARRELQARELAARERLDVLVRGAISSAEWYLGGERVAGAGTTANEIASRLAFAWYSGAPRLRNELLNRDRPSSNAVAARRALMHRMTTGATRAGLGIAGTPPEMAAYLGLIKANGLHVFDEAEGLWTFRAPREDGPGASLMPLWREFADFLSATSNAPLTLNELFIRWRARPIGLRAGVAPVLALAFILSEEEGLAFYDGSEFTAHLSEFVVDRLLQDPSLVSVRRFGPGSLRRVVLDRLAGLASAFSRQEFTQVTPLAVVKPLFDFVRGLPAWTLRTRSLDPMAIAVRDAIAATRDPVALLFDQLPLILRTGRLDAAQGSEAFVRELAVSLRALAAAYPAMMGDIRRIVLSGLSDGREGADLGAAAARGKSVMGRTGDFRLDAFAQRLGGAAAGGEAWVEQLASLAVNKPAREWTDADLEGAKVEMSELVNRFRRVERLLSKPETGGTTLIVNVATRAGIVERAAFLSGELDEAELEVALRTIREGLNASGTDRSVQMLALAQALQDILKSAEGGAKDPLAVSRHSELPLQ